MILRHIPTGCTVEVPDGFGDHNDQAYWGMIGPHQRRWPDGYVETVEVRTTMLRRADWFQADE